MKKNGKHPFKNLQSKPPGVCIILSNAQTYKREFAKMISEQVIRDIQQGQEQQMYLMQLYSFQMTKPTSPLSFEEAANI